jgi:hypothetical protein
MNAAVMSRRLAVSALIVLLTVAGLPCGAAPMGGDEQPTLSCTVVQRVVSARTAQLTERGEHQVTAWPADDLQRTDALVAQHPRPHFRPSDLPLQSLLSVYRI